MKRTILMIAIALCASPAMAHPHQPIPRPIQYQPYGYFWFPRIKILAEKRQQFQQQQQQGRWQFQPGRYEFVPGEYRFEPQQQRPSPQQRPTPQQKVYR